MPRQRWAIRCHARLTDGSRQCRAWSVRGAFTCQSHGSVNAGARKAAKRRLAEAATIERVSRAGGLDPARIVTILGPGFTRDLRQLVRAAREQLDAEAPPPAPDPAAVSLARLRSDPSRRRRL